MLDIHHKQRFVFCNIVGKRLLRREGRGDAEERRRNAVFAGRVLCS